jgi:hypothetical protein
LQSFGDNVVGETAQISSVYLPVSLSTVPVNTQFTLDVALDGEVFSPGGEVISRAFLRDPAHIDDADPLTGRSRLFWVRALSFPSLSL